MIRAAFVRVLAALACLVTAAAQADARINKSLFGALALDGYDAVAYQTEHRATPGKAAFTYRWQNANWRFTSAEHLNAFKAEPERYAPQYGGWCAYALGAKDELVDVDPEAFSVVDGKLYLNYSKAVRAQWEADRAALIEAADRHWHARRQP